MQDQLYKIGAVAQETGLAVERLRAWERRYGFDPAHKVNRTRYYDKDQVAKLSLIKELLERGHSIKQLVALTIDELKELTDTRPSVFANSECSLTLVGPAIQEMEANAATGNCEIAGRMHSLDELESNLDTIGHTDAMIVETDSLDAERLGSLKEALSIPLIVVYRYASKQDIDEATEKSLSFHKLGEVSWNDLLLIVVQQLGNLKQSSRGEKRFSEAELYHLSRTRFTGDIAPKDLVDIVLAQRALASHVNRHTNNAFGVELAGVIQLSAATMEDALELVAKEYELFS
ncbi:MAG: MerR family transcriptional regulator [Gammaproteobacteria bacterium]|nr:MerR family transcriptional regulator [Gammaproteobacteria bacterium]